MQLSYSLFLLLISICVTYAARKCPTPEDCEEKCLQYATHKITGCLKCECVPFEGVWEGDIKLTNHTKASLQKALNNKSPKGILMIADKWTDYRKKGEWWIPYEFHSSLSMASKLVIPYAMADLELKTCLRFHPRKKNQKQYLQFAKLWNCWAEIGKNKPGAPPNLISINRCNEKGTIIHLLLHAIGFWHEQTRQDRDNHIKIQWANVRRGSESQFQKYDSSFIGTYGVGYDIGSIMHSKVTEYAISQFRPTMTDLNGRRLQTQREVLSESDIKQINLMYRCGPERKCRDMKKGKLCKAFVKRGQCQSHPQEAVRECRKSCELCE